MSPAASTTASSVSVTVRLYAPTAPTGTAFVVAPCNELTITTKYGSFPSFVLVPRDRARLDGFSGSGVPFSDAYANNCGER